MKRVLLAAVTLISVAFVGNANAQTGNTDNVTVNIKLKPIHTLVVNPSQKIVDLVYTTEAQYNSGVFVEEQDHLKIFSTGAFEIKVRTGGNFESNPSGESIEASTVKVTSTAGTTKPSANASYGEKALSNTDQQIVSNTTGGRDLTVNVKYTGAGNDAYINKFSKGRGTEENVFTAQVTYTILAL